MQIVYLIIIGFSVLGTVLAWKAKLKWHQQYLKAKEETLKIKSQIAVLNAQLIFKSKKEELENPERAGEAQAVENLINEGSQNKIPATEVISLLTEIKDQTSYVWKKLIELDTENKSFKTEIKESTFFKINYCLKRLQTCGHLTFSVIQAGKKIADKEKVYKISVLNISIQLKNLARLIENTLPDVLE